VSPVRYELGFYIPEDGILHSHRRENLKPYISIMFLRTLTHCTVALMCCDMSAQSHNSADTEQPTNGFPRPSIHDSDNGRSAGSNALKESDRSVVRGNARPNMDS
jgi:hypothetical protein